MARRVRSDLRYVYSVGRTLGNANGTPVYVMMSVAEVGVLGEFGMIWWVWKWGTIS